MREKTRFKKNWLKDLRAQLSGLRLLQISHNNQYQNFVDEIKNLSSSNELASVYLLCCPDYSYTIDSSGWAIFNYNKMGQSPGMLAYAYSRAVLEITKTILNFDKKLKIMIKYGDNEASDTLRLNNLRITKAEFINNIRVTQASSRVFYSDIIDTYLINKKKIMSENISVISSGMQDSFYTPQIIKLANDKLKTVPKQKILEILELRKNVIENTYKKDPIKNYDFFLEKAKEQIFDRLVVGTALSIEKDRGKSVSILTLTPPSLIEYFNYKNRNNVPVLEIGTT